MRIPSMCLLSYHETNNGEVALTIRGIAYGFKRGKKEERKTKYICRVELGAFIPMIGEEGGRQPHIDIYTKTLPSIFCPFNALHLLLFFTISFHFLFKILMIFPPLLFYTPSKVDLQNPIY